MLTRTLSKTIVPSIINLANLHPSIQTSKTWPIESPKKQQKWILQIPEKRKETTQTRKRRKFNIFNRPSPFTNSRPPNIMQLSHLGNRNKFPLPLGPRSPWRKPKWTPITQTSVTIMQATTSTTAPQAWISASDSHPGAIYLKPWKLSLVQAIKQKIWPHSKTVFKLT